MQTSQNLTIEEDNLNSNGLRLKVSAHCSSYLHFLKQSVMIDSFLRVNMLVLIIISTFLRGTSLLLNMSENAQL